jgi:hypothetical protein
VDQICQISQSSTVVLMPLDHVAQFLQLAVVQNSVSIDAVRWLLFKTTRNQFSPMGRGATPGVPIHHNLDVKASRTTRRQLTDEHKGGHFRSLPSRPEHADSQKVVVI